MSNINQTMPANKPRLGRIISTAFLSILSFVIINTILYFFGSQVLGGFNEVSVGGTSLLSLVNIIGASITFPILGLIVYLVLVFGVKVEKTRFSIFRALGYGLVVFMFFGPLGLENAKVSDIILLEIMHLIVGIGFVEGMIKRTKSKAAI
jgi:hypothetical protein